MRTYKSTSVVALIASLFVAASSFGAGISGVQWYDLSGWDSSLIENGPGQTFDLGGGLTMKVQGFGDFSYPSSWTPSNYFLSGHTQANDRNQFHFTFNKSQPVVFAAATVDSNEHVQVIGVGAEEYHHVAGLNPIETSITSGLQLQGVGYGGDASNGQIKTYAQLNQAVILRHDSLSANKYEYFRIGTVPVPEPNAAGLLSLGVLGLVLSRRKRRVS